MRLPEHLKTKICPTDEPVNKKVRKILSGLGLNTVCDNARCPNKTKCYCSGTATFLIMGKICTRNCKFCNISHDTPESLNQDEPQNVARAIKELDLKYCVITSVTRDDLEDFGAKHFAHTIKEIKKLTPNTKIEVLTPDFCGSEHALDLIIEAKPDVFNHNVETVSSMYKKAREMANYKRSLEVLNYVSTNSNIVTKTGIMVGLGETFDELEELFYHIAQTNCKILTIGQYICPSKKHLPVEKYYTPEEFELLDKMAQSAGIAQIVSAPLARSSFRAHESYQKLVK